MPGTKVQITCLNTLGSKNAKTNEERYSTFTQNSNNKVKFGTVAFVIGIMTSNGPYITISSNIVNKVNDLALAD